MNKINKRSIALLFPIFIIGLLISCSETDYMVYDSNYSGLYFTSDTLSYSFGVTPTDVRSYEYRIPVSLMGKPESLDRTFSFSVVEEGTTAEYGVQYVIGKPVIMADSVVGYIPVILKRDELGGNYQDGYIHYKLSLNLEADGVFTPTLSKEENSCVLVFDNAVEQPEWLNAVGEKVWYESQWGEWHPLKLIKMVEFFHSIESVQPETYKKMVKVFGENLEHVQYGDFYPYKTVMNKYVFKPMYDYFIAPENYEEIVDLYPDFPFDFPNPYA